MSVVELAGGKYLSLGDSLSSGEGTFDYISPTDNQDSTNNMCHTSNVAFPTLIHSIIGLDQHNSFACSGAKVVNVSGGGGVSTDPQNNSNSDNQYYDPDYLSGHAAYWTPGLVRQIERVKDIKPDIVTISIGINDVGFESKLERCLGLGTCFNSYKERKEVAQSIANQFYRLSDVYKKIKQGAAPTAKIYVVGYPSIIDIEGTNCAANVKLGSAEKQFVEASVDWLNEVIEAAANRAGVHYVDIQSSLNGHRMCEVDYSVGVAINGVTAGGDHPVFQVFGQGPRLIGSETYHPNKFGHRLMRDTIVSKTGAFTATSPAPDLSVTSPLVNDSMPLLAAFTDNSLPLKDVIYSKDLSDSVIYKTDGVIVASVSGADFNTRSGDLYTVEIHSTPVPLGTFTSDDNGNIDISTSLPSGLAPGFHTLHVYGKDLDNKDVDIYKTIYIAETEDDWDGDEVENSEDPCPLYEASGIDEDEDGIDDACDPIIGELPEEDPEELSFIVSGGNYMVHATHRRKHFNEWKNS